MQLTVDKRVGRKSVKVPVALRRTYRNPITSEVDLTDDEVEFMKLVQRYKDDNHRPFPTYSEILGVLRSMGYRKVADPEPLPVHVRGSKGGSHR